MSHGPRTRGKTEREPDDQEIVRAFGKLEEDIVRLHDMHPTDSVVEQHLGLALMHVRKARGQRVVPPNPYKTK